MWLNEFKAAIVTQDLNKIDALLDTMPEFETMQELEEAFYLFKHGKELLAERKEQTAHTMKNIKNHITFMESSESTNAPKLDIMQ